MELRALAPEQIIEHRFQRLAVKRNLDAVRLLGASAVITTRPVSTCVPTDIEDTYSCCNCSIYLPGRTGLIDTWCSLLL